MPNADRESQTATAHRLQGLLTEKCTLDLSSAGLTQRRRSQLANDSLNGFGGKFAEVFPVVGCELTHVPKAPAHGDLIDHNVRLSILELTANTIQANSLQIRFRCNANMFHEGVLQCALAHVRSLANVSNSKRFIGIFRNEAFGSFYCQISLPTRHVVGE